MQTKKRIPISIRFTLRKDYNSLLCRLSVDGDNGNLFNPVKKGEKPIPVEGHWNQELQRVDGYSSEVRAVNLTINQIWTELNAIYDAQVERGFVPTPKSVQGEFQTGRPYTGLAYAKEHKYSAVRCYRTYLHELQSGAFSEKVLAQTTLDKWKYGLTYLDAYVAHTKDQDLLSLGSVDQLTPFWGKSYHRWLMKQGPHGMAAESATRYVNRLIEVINHMAESGAIKHNPLATLKLPRDKTKEVYFLEPDHLERFWQLALPGEKGVACWWMGLIFLTGLDYPDAKRYIQDRATYERDTPYGRKVVINRSKPPLAECHIPMLPALTAHLAKVPAGAPPTSDDINEEMRIVEVLIGFSHRLTCKVGRKTAGAIFYAEYGDIGAVSRMLGHSSVSITERYYVKTTGHTVDKTMRKRYVAPDPHQSIRRNLGASNSSWII